MDSHISVWSFQMDSIKWFHFKCHYFRWYNHNYIRMTVNCIMKLLKRERWWRKTKSPHIIFIDTKDLWNGAMKSLVEDCGDEWTLCYLYSSYWDVYDNVKINMWIHGGVTWNFSYSCRFILRSFFTLLLDTLNEHIYEAVLYCNNIFLVKESTEWL